MRWMHINSVKPADESQEARNGVLVSSPMKCRSRAHRRGFPALFSTLRILAASRMKSTRTPVSFRSHLLSYLRSLPDTFFNFPLTSPSSPSSLLKLLPREESYTERSLISGPPPPPSLSLSLSCACVFIPGVASRIFLAYITNENDANRVSSRDPVLAVSLLAVSPPLSTSHSVVAWFKYSMA